jgi:hypothetical protein
MAAAAGRFGSPAAASYASARQQEIWQGDDNNHFNERTLMSMVMNTLSGSFDETRARMRVHQRGFFHDDSQVTNRVRLGETRLQDLTILGFVSLDEQGHIVPLDPALRFAGLLQAVYLSNSGIPMAVLLGACTIYAPVEDLVEDRQLINAPVYIDPASKHQGLTLRSSGVRCGRLKNFQMASRLMGHVQILGHGTTPVHYDGRLREV